MCDGEIEEMINIVDRNGDGKIRERAKKKKASKTFFVSPPYKFPGFNLFFP